MQNRLNIRIIFEVALRQFAWWFIAVLLVSVSGYPGVVCVTPMAWLLALRAGNQVAWRSPSGQRSQRLTEAALTGALLGLLQGILFGIVVPFMGPIQEDERVNSMTLVAAMLVIGMAAGAGLSFFTAFLNENRRKN
jgi:hypothetical protein